MGKILGEKGTQKIPYFCFMVNLSDKSFLGFFFANLETSDLGYVGFVLPRETSKGEREED